MSALDTIISTPQLVEVESIEVAAPVAAVWQRIRFGNLATSSLVKALFAIRTLPSRLRGKPSADDELRLRIEDFVSTPDRPGFRLLAEAPPHELVVGAIGKVWHLDIPFVHVEDAAAFAAFQERDFVKVAWALRVEGSGVDTSRVSVEVRVAATDEASWRRFRRYFRIVGPGSRFIRRSLLRDLARDLGSVAGCLEKRRLPGDGLLPDARLQMTNMIDIDAPPAEVWPWLVQMGCLRGGFSSWDVLDNRPRRSAREIHPELQQLQVGDRIAATPSGKAAFEVLSCEPHRALVLGILTDAASGKQLDFSTPRPERFAQSTWALVLEPTGDRSTRLFARARAVFSEDASRRALWIRPVHDFMQSAQLRHLKARAESRLAQDDWRDVASGLGGAAMIAASFFTPPLRERRSRWGLDAATAARELPGDHFIATPRWSWTHAVEIDAPASDVWPWIAQIGVGRGGFYSYQWLENLAGCDVRNAETVHPDWEIEEGAPIVLHPSVPPLRAVLVERGHHFVARAAPDEAAVAAGRPWAEATWLFLVEPLGARRSRLVSRYRLACSDDLATRLAFGPTFVEPVGFAMDRKMLLGVKQRAEGRL